VAVFRARCSNKTRVKYNTLRIRINYRKNDANDEINLLGLTVGLTGSGGLEVFMNLMFYLDNGLALSTSTIR